MRALVSGVTATHGKVLTRCRIVVRRKVRNRPMKPEPLVRAAADWIPVPYRLRMSGSGPYRRFRNVREMVAIGMPVQPVDATLGAAGNKITMTACQTLAQSLSASPTATSYPTTKFSLPPSYHHEISDLSAYNRSFPLR